MQNADDIDRKRLYKAIFRIFGMWVSIYIGVAIPFWLEKGRNIHTALLITVQAMLLFLMFILVFEIIVMLIT